MLASRLDFHQLLDHGGKEIGLQLVDSGRKEELLIEGLLKDGREKNRRAQSFPDDGPHPVAVVIPERNRGLYDWNVEGPVDILQQPGGAGVDGQDVANLVLFARSECSRIASFVFFHRVQADKCQMKALLLVDPEIELEEFFVVVGIEIIAVVGIEKKAVAQLLEGKLSGVGDGGAGLNLALSGIDKI